MEKQNQKISISVMAHPSRAELFPYLKEKLGDVPFSIDDGRGIFENSKEAWKLYNPEAEHHVVIQDDAIIGKDFFENAEKTIREHPNQAISFYFGNRANLREIAGKAEKAGGILLDNLSWGVAICLPTKLIPEMVKFFDSVPKTSRFRNHDDTTISKFLNKKQIRVWYPMPSLVDHRTRQASLVEENENNSRRAYKFIGQ